jgi:hypothetical protein
MICEDRLGVNVNLWCELKKTRENLFKRKRRWKDENIKCAGRFCCYKGVRLKQLIWVSASLKSQPRLFFL